MAFSSRSVGGEGGGGGGNVGGTWDLVAYFKVDTLFRAAMRSFKLLFPLFNAIPSSSSLEVLSGRAIIRVGV